MNHSFITICDSFYKSYHNDERLIPDSYLGWCVCLLCHASLLAQLDRLAWPWEAASGVRAGVVIALTKYDLKQFITQYLGKSDTFKQN